MRLTNGIAWTLGGLLVLFLALGIPDRPPPVAPAPPRGGAFAWNRDAFWHALEQRFVAARGSGCRSGTTTVRGAVDRLARIPLDPASAELDSVERRFFELAPVIAACPREVLDYVQLSGQWREAIKWQSQQWDVSSAAARARLYRSLYGARAAVEEVMLQAPDTATALLRGRDEPSATPVTTVRGVQIHSGDILVSRGGYPTSALIARGNDYPGNFSHVALVYVDSATHVASTIEAHIERGVAVSTADQYLGDKKLRIMVLRLRHDLPALVRDPMLPHRAATLAYERARAGHIPYDFEMDYTDASRLFCSEVASAVYRELGVTLWTGLSTISRPGLRRWLADFGVRHFETQEPSDLEYDPQLVVVAEWRDPTTLLRDHIDNAVIDAMLEGADSGDALSYPWTRLPLVRLAKGASWVLERFGKTGPVPEGMSATAALRNRAFSARQRLLALRVSAAADSATRAQGYVPPYWRLLDLARAMVRPAAAGP